MIRRRMIDAAVAAAARGWPVFPLVPGSKRPRAQLTGWESKATVDCGRIWSWWSRHPDDNVAIATGPAALVVVDLDLADPDETPPPEWQQASGGADVLAAVSADRGVSMTPTFTVATPSGGRHLYYRAPESMELRCTAGRLGWKIDTRAAGGYVVAAGSTLPNGEYAVRDDRVPAALPAWLEQALRPPSGSPSSALVGPRPGRADDYGAAALHGEVDRVLSAPPGRRNAALNLAAWNLGRLVAAAVLDRSVVEDTLCEAGRRAGGQTPAGVSATVRSAINTRLRRSVGPQSPEALGSPEGARQ